MGENTIVRAARDFLSHRITEEELVEGDHIYSWRDAYAYAHHGVYVGDNNIIHFTQGKDKSHKGQSFVTSCVSRICSSMAPAQAGNTGGSARSDGGGGNTVSRVRLSAFLDGGSLYRFRYGVDKSTFLTKRGGTCTMAKASPVPEVLHRAWYLLDHGFGDYNLFCNNCEDFAVYCKTGLLPLNQGNLGIGRSNQVASFAFVPASVLHVPIGRMLLSGPLMAGVSVAASVGLHHYGRYMSDIGVCTDAIQLDVEELVQNMRWDGRPRRQSAGPVS